jgi:hypothetical protein
MYRMVDLRRVHVYGDPDNFCAEISVANLGNGELVGVLAQNRGLAHTDTGTIILVRSKDHGATWDPGSRVVVFAQEEDAGWNVAAVCRLSDGTLLAHANRWRYLDRGRIDRLHGQSEIDGVWLSRSSDTGQTWSPPERVNFAPMRNARVRDAIVELPNGDLLMPLHGFRWQRTMPDIASAERERAFVLWSPNRGSHGRDCAGGRRRAGRVQLPNQAHGRAHRGLAGRRAVVAGRCLHARLLRSGRRPPRFSHLGGRTAEFRHPARRALAHRVPQLRSSRQWQGVHRLPSL